MQEVKKIAYLLLKHNILSEKLRRFVLKLPSSRDVKEAQVATITGNYLLGSLAARDGDESAG